MKKALRDNTQMNQSVGMKIFNTSAVYNKMIANDTMRSSKIIRQQSILQQNYYQNNSVISSYENELNDLKAQLRNLKEELVVQEKKYLKYELQIDKERKTLNQQKEEYKMKQNAINEKKNNDEFADLEASQRNKDIQQMQDNEQKEQDSIEINLKVINEQLERIHEKAEPEKQNQSNEIQVTKNNIERTEQMIAKKENEMSQLLVRRKAYESQLHDSGCYYYPPPPQQTRVGGYNAFENITTHVQKNEETVKVEKIKKNPKKEDENIVKNQNSNIDHKEENAEKKEEMKEETQEEKREKRVQKEKKRLEDKKMRAKLNKDLKLMPSFMESKKSEDKQLQLLETTINNKTNQSQQEFTDQGQPKSMHIDYEYESQSSSTDSQDLQRIAEQNIEEDERRYTQVIEFIKYLTIILISYFLDLIVFMVAIYPISILFALLKVCYFILKFEWSEAIKTHLIFFVSIIFGSSVTLFVEVMFFYYISTDTIEKLWFLDAFIYMLTSITVISYIKGVHTSIDSCCGIFQLENFINQKITNTLFITSDDNAHVFDSISIQNKNDAFLEYKRIMDSYQAQQITLLYKKFIPEGDHLKFSNKGFDMVKRQLEWLSPSVGQYLILSVLITVKTLLCLVYLFLYQLTFSLETSVMIVVTALFYMNMTWSLSKALSSQDLRRKISMMDSINKMMDFKAATKADLETGALLDITCPISCETWDNVRKFTADFHSEKLKKLEFAYVCFFFNYIFVAFICIVSYGELYTIIPKDSLYLQPLMTIQNSFDFLFLNALLLCRIYYGSQYNNKFNESEEKIDELIGITEDLSQMFDYFFLKDAQFDVQKVDTAQYFIVRRIKHVSDVYFKKNIRFLGAMYKDIYKLQRDMLNNMHFNFEKIKKQIQIDRESQCYKFLNVFKLTFAETMGSVAIAFVSFLPSVINKIIHMFQNGQES